MADAGSSAVWTEAVWNRCLVRQVPNPYEPLALGCDKARFGDDFTSIIVRRGNCVLHHETHNGWNNNEIAGRLKQLCRRFALTGEDPRRAVVRIDDVQGAIVDQADGYNFQAVNSSHRASRAGAFPNKRSELWFETLDRAAEGRLDLSRLDEESRNRLRTQAMAPTWRIDAQGRRVVEPKADTKKRLGRSPDDMDALNLAFYAGSDWKEAAEATSLLVGASLAGAGIW